MNWYLIHTKPRQEKCALQNLERQLVGDYQVNPELVVYIRAPESGFNKFTYAVIDACQKNGITRFSLRTESRKSP